MAENKKFGNQLPTTSVILPYEDSLYQQAIDLYQKTGRNCYEWQLNMLKDIMATQDDGLWTHQKFGYSIPRRNGKTEIIYMLEFCARITRTCGGDPVSYHLSDVVIWYYPHMRG